MTSPKVVVRNSIAATAGTARGYPSACGCAGWELRPIYPPDSLRLTSSGQAAELVRKPKTSEVTNSEYQAFINELKLEQKRLLEHQTTERDRRTRYDRQEENRRLSELEKKIASSQEFWRNVVAIITSHPDVSLCPICGCGEKPSAPERRFSSSENGYYRYSCPVAHASWGTQICGSCRVRFSFFGPAVFPYRMIAQPAG